MIQNCGVDAEFDALSYAYAASAGTGSDSGIMGERNLWCAVIAQAFLDIGVIRPAKAPGVVGPHEKNPERREYREALEWILSDKQDFHMICQMAGVSPSTIRQAAMRHAGACLS